MGYEVAVVGCGNIGLMAIRWAKAFGAKKVFAIDIDEMCIRDSIEGAESEKRNFLLNLLRPSLSIYENHKNVVAEHVSVQAGDSSVIQKILGEQEQRYKKYLDDSSFREIILYLRIMVNRNQMGEFLEPQPDTNSENYTVSYTHLLLFTRDRN